MVLLLVFLIIIIFSNQYLLFNEEFFIILAFLCLCFFVKTNLGSLVDNELRDRKNKILTSYLSFLTKKSQNLNTNAKNIKEKIVYLFNYSEIQLQYFDKFVNLLNLLKVYNYVELNKNFESNFIFYFANLVSNKRKFL